MKSGKVSFIFVCAVLWLLSACTAKAPAALRHAAPAEYEVEIHEFHVGSTDVCFIFDRDKTLLIDRSQNRDPALIEAYLSTQAVSHLDYVLCTTPPASGKYPFPSVGTVLPVGTAEMQSLAIGGGFTLDTCTVSLTEEEGTPTVLVTYKNTPYSFPLQARTASDVSVENATVTIIKPSPDGVQTEITQRQLT